MRGIRTMFVWLLMMAYIMLNLYIYVDTSISHWVFAIVFLIATYFIIVSDAKWWQADADALFRYSVLMSETKLLVATMEKIHPGIRDEALKAMSAIRHTKV